VGPRASLDVCEKSRPHRDLIPGPSIPQPIAIPTELSWPQILSTGVNNTDTVNPPHFNISLVVSKCIAARS
jgi:hypothetical protein